MDGVLRGLEVLESKHQSMSALALRAGIEPALLSLVERGKRPCRRTAVRIAAALNAPDVGDEGDYGFFWITAVTTDGEIVVANSYGLAYIPDGVELPHKVYMASADRTICP